MSKKKTNVQAKIDPVINLEIKVSDNQSILSREQIKFNKLNARIQKLKSQIQSDTQKLDEFLSLYVSIVVPEQKLLIVEKLNLAKEIDAKLAFIKLPKKLTNQVEQLMIQILDEVIGQSEPNEELNNLYKKYNGRTYEEDLQEEKEEMAEMFSKFFYESTGFKFDPEDLKNENPDFEKMRDSFTQFNEQNKKSRKKSKKQIEKEALEEEKQKLKGKSLRSIYLSLAKILHPDKETDETLKHQQEEYMKLATTAYESKDLAGLLRLEVQWISLQTSSLDSIPDETLKAYSMLLNDQVRELEAEAYSIPSHPRYAPILRYQRMNPKYINSVMTNEAGQIKSNRQILIEWQGDLEDKSLVKETLKECVESMLDEEEEDMDLLNMLFR